jgi:hypothetical protein
MMMMMMNKMVEAAGSSTLLIATYQTTRCHSLKTVNFTVTTVRTCTLMLAGMFIIQQQNKLKFYNPLSFIHKFFANYRSYYYSIIAVQDKYWFYIRFMTMKATY